MKRALVLALLCGCSTPGAAPGTVLRAGVAEVDITPPLGYRMAGYFSERLNTGTRDPLMAKAVVFEQGDTKAALVFCDLIGMPRAISSKARELASAKTGIPASHISIAATHSHTGPLFYGGVRKFLHERAVAAHGKDPTAEIDYPAVLVEKLVDVIEKAYRALVNTTLAAGVASQEPPLSFNRRYHMKDGTVRFNPGQQNPEIVRVAGPIDPEVGILRLHGASLTVFATHLDTLGGTSYSADYPFFLERDLRAKFGPPHISLFGAGTCGDINHIDTSIKGKRNTEEIGSQLARTVVAALPNLRPIERPSLAVRIATVQAPMQRYMPDQIAWARETVAKIGQKVPFLEMVKAATIIDLQLREGDRLPLEVHAFRLSSDVAIVTLPGEVFVELGLAIKKASPFKMTLVIELANDNPAYIPTTKAFAEGSYETVNSRILPGGGEMMVAAAVKLLRELAP